MTVNHFIRLLKENTLWIILFPLLTAGAVYYFTRNEQKEYTAKATVYTGLASGYNIQSVNKSGTPDYTTISNAFDNLLTTLNSNETMRQIGLRLLAHIDFIFVVFKKYPNQRQSPLVFLLFV